MIILPISRNALYHTLKKVYLFLWEPSLQRFYQFVKFLTLLGIISKSTSEKKLIVWLIKQQFVDKVLKTDVKLSATFNKNKNVSL